MAAASFRVSADVVAQWKDQLSQQRGVRGVEAVLKEVLEALQREGEDQHVPLERHTVFAWTQALQGAAAKAPGGAGAAVARVAEDMRSYLAPPGEGRGAKGEGLGPGATGQAPGAMGQGPAAAPVPPPAWAPLSVTPAPSAPGWTPAPPVVYAPGGATPSAPIASGATRLVSERESGMVVAQLVREARSELLLVSPWGAGLDTLLGLLHQLPPGVQVRILTRRPPPQDEGEFHRQLMELRKRGADVVASPYLHTRMVVVDGARALVGAAGAGHNASREVATLTADAGVAAAAREAFFRMMEEARGK